MKWVSFDTETTGLDPDVHQVIQIAMVIEDTNADPLPNVRDLPRLDLGMWYTHYNWSDAALGINAKLAKVLDSDHRPAFQANHNSRRLQIVRSFNGWALVEKFLLEEGGGQRVFLGGKNVGSFDLQFLPPKIRRLCHHRILDVGSVALGAQKYMFQMDDIPSMGTLMDAFFPDSPVSHDALFDAYDNIRVVRKVTNDYGRRYKSAEKKVANG